MVEEVWRALRQVVDPEVGIDVVSLGLVYAVEAGDRRVRVVLTMTSPACPLGELLAEQAEAAIRAEVPGVDSVVVDLVWDPPWNPSMMSPAARQRLGAT